jgi:predicted RNase H-like HicB family nuclease
LTLYYRIRLKEDKREGGYVVTSPDVKLKGLATAGDTQEEAIKNAYDAVSLLLNLSRDYFALVLK